MMASVTSHNEVKSHNETVLANLEEGDIVEFERGVFSHYGVYVGQENIIHLAGDEDDGLGNVGIQHSSSSSGKKFRKASIKMEKFWKVADNCKAYKKNKDDGNKFRPYSKKEIVRNAEAKLGRVGYNLISDNCEHFANWCRYGIKQSDQVDGFFTWLLLGVGAVGVVRAAASMGEKEDKQKQ